MAAEFGPDREILPGAVAVSDGKVFFQNEKALVALAAESGQLLWSASRPTARVRETWSAPTLVVSDGVVLLADREAGHMIVLGRKDAEIAPPENRSTAWIADANSGSGEKVQSGVLTAYNAITGSQLWPRRAAKGMLRRRIYLSVTARFGPATQSR